MRCAASSSSSCPLLAVELDRPLERQTRGDGVELWAAEVDGQVVSARRIDPVPGTAFAGIWGGATLPEFRGRGIYRALTAARVHSAMAWGVRWIHSDSTELSRPILERAGLVKATETVPWTWERGVRAMTADDSATPSGVRGDRTAGELISRGSRTRARWRSCCAGSSR